MCNIGGGIAYEDILCAILVVGSGGMVEFVIYVLILCAYPSNKDQWTYLCLTEIRFKSYGPGYEGFEIYIWNLSTGVSDIYLMFEW